MGPTYHASSMHGSHDVQMAGGLKIVALVLGGVHGLIENQIVYLTACMSVDFLGQLVMFKVCLANLVPLEVSPITNQKFCRRNLASVVHKSATNRLLKV